MQTNSPNSNADLIHQVVQSFKARDKAAATTTLAPMPFDADDAAAQCLALLADPDADFVPADAWRSLAAQNDAMLNASKPAIKRALIRQSTLLQAAAYRYMARAATAAKPEHAAALMQISLGCSRALVTILGAINAMDDAERNADAIAV